MLEQAIVDGLSAGLFYALVALGFALVFETCRFFDLGQGGIYVVGFYLAYFLVRTVGLPLTIGCVIAIGIAGCFGSILHRAIYVRIRSRTTGTVPLLVASLAVLTLTQNLVSLVWGPDTKTIRPEISSASITMFRAHITPIQIVSMAAALAAYALVGVFRHFTSWGRKVRAIGDDRELATILGVRVDTVTIMTVGLASGITALAAILASLDTDMSPTAAFPAVLMAWVTTVLGGSGRIVNVLLAGLVLGLIQHTAVLWASSSWQDVIVYGVLLVFLLLRPRGLASVRSAVIER